MEIVYSEHPVENAGGRRVIDPATFSAPLKGIAAVYYDGKNLNIVYGYETLGVPVRPLSSLPSKKTKRSRKGR